jgi:fumarate reductase flavoprotein subunit
MPTLEYEPISIMDMELPPGFRGYGSKGNIIEHPDAAIRQKEVDEIREKMVKQGKDRIEIQDAIMPYRLQREYKAINFRVGDRL